MDKAQAINKYWNSFGIKAYDENTVPQDASFPYITYNTVTDDLDNVIPLHASLWYRSTSWKDISLKEEEIAKSLGGYGDIDNLLKIEGGYLWMYRGTPFAQRMSDPEDDMIRRIYINVLAEFLTAY